MFLRWYGAFVLGAVLLLAGCPAGAPNPGGDDPNDGACEDGSVSLVAALTGTGGQSGDAAYRRVSEDCQEFIVRVEGFAEGTYDVTAGDQVVGQVTVDAGGEGELLYASVLGNFPVVFPDLAVGDEVAVGGLAAGALAESCPAQPQLCELPEPDDNENDNEPADGETCTEDASESVEVIITFDSSLPAPSACVNIQEELDRRQAIVQFRNNHPTRTVAIAAITIEESDKEELPIAPCDVALMYGTFGSVEECLEGLAGGCDAPPGLFVGPGETSPATWLYQCLREELYPGSGTCGEMELESIRTRVLAHAVYCDDYDTAQANFCATAHEGLLTTGLPVAPWEPIEADECP